MLKIVLSILLFTGWGCIASAQKPDSLKLEYEANKRNIRIVKEYADALEAARMGKEAERVIREYMAGCPVLQIEDKETYLLISRYVFEDPYANVFEYGIYAVRKMRWDRVEKNLGGKEARLMSIFKGLGKGVSGGDEIDKRYEVLMLLSLHLQREVDRLCKPVYQKEKYGMPEYLPEKMDRLEYLVNKGELLGQDGLRVKLRVARHYYSGNFAKSLHDLCVAADLNLTDIRGEYLIAMMNILTDQALEQPDFRQALLLAQRLCSLEEQERGSLNYYNLLGKLYGLTGDPENSEKYTRLGNELEAERMARYGDLLKTFNQK